MENYKMSKFYCSNIFNLGDMWGFSQLQCDVIPVLYINYESENALIVLLNPWNIIPHLQCTQQIFDTKLC